eukprot:scaffold565257_cov27-Prasinocladus_malaysianus.AAC.1
MARSKKGVWALGARSLEPREEGERRNQAPGLRDHGVRAGAGTSASTSPLCSEYEYEKSAEVDDDARAVDPRSEMCTRTGNRTSTVAERIFHRCP